MTATSLRLRTLVAALATAFPLALHANPLDPTVAVGHASFDTAGTTLTVTNSAGAVIDWGSFSIGVGETTRFVQPSSISAVLNRITGGDPSQILGTLSSNGQVFLINPNGIMFGAGSVVDVAGLVASTLPLANADFAAGRFAFGADLGTATPGALRVDGSLISATGGKIWLIAGSIEQRGAISAPEGQVLLAAGQRITVVDTHRPDVRVELAAGAEAVNVGRIVGGQIGIYAGAIRQDGIVSATHAALGDDGSVVLRATSTLSTSVDSRIDARSADGARGGSVQIAAGDMLWHDGRVDVSARETGGQVAMTSTGLQQSGRVAAGATHGTGGAITQSVTTGSLVHTASAVLDASGATGGGALRVTSDSGRVFSSGTWTVTASSGTGGSIVTTGDSVVLAAATLDATGATRGGDVRIGGGWRGEDASIANSGYTRTMGGTAIRADATASGDGGSVVLWSDGRTRFAGTIDARGAGSAGDGGRVEVSGVDGVNFTGHVSTLESGTGTRGSLLLDPKFIVITADGGVLGYSGIDFEDPNPTPDSATRVDLGSGEQDYGFGNPSRIVFGSTRVVIRAPLATVGALVGAGAIYRFDSETGALTATLTGAAANDRIGSGDAEGDNGLPFAGNRFLLSSPFWNDERGAVTQLNLDAANFGVSGSTISSTNSLVGSSVGDQVSASNIHDFFNGGAIALRHTEWNAGRGAITFLPAGANLPTGPLDSTRSFTGLAPDDRLADGGFVSLGSGHAAWVASGFRSNTGLVRVFSLASPITGESTIFNSLLGGLSGDRVGETGIALVGPDRYAVFSHLWSSQRGAVTIGALAAPRVGTVGTANSLVGANGGVNGDRIGLSYTTRFFQIAGSDRWLLDSRDWNNDRGAWTVIDPSAPVVGVVGAANSLVGSSVGDSDNSAAFSAGADGTYFVVAPGWDNGSNVEAGAVARGTAASPLTGLLSSATAIIGSNAGDRIGADVGPENDRFLIDGTALLVASPDWNGSRGAITRVDASNRTGVVSSANSFVGELAGAGVGGQLIRLSNGNFVSVAPDLERDGVAETDVGAVTFIHQTDGLLGGGGFVGVPTLANSLMRTISGSRTGSGGILEIDRASGDPAFLVLSPEWSASADSREGAVTWIDGVTGRFANGNLAVGQITSANSLVGGDPGDNIGHFDDGSGFDRTVDVIGSFASFGDAVGIVIRSPNWNNQRGAVTWMDPDTGEIFDNGVRVAGAVVDVTNSFVGTIAGTRGPGDARFRGDRFGETFAYLDGTPRYLIGSPYSFGGAGSVAAFTSGGDDGGRNVVTNARAGTIATSNAFVAGAPADPDFGGDQFGRLGSGTEVYTGYDSQFVARHVLHWRSGEDRDHVITWIGTADGGDMPFGNDFENTSLFIAAVDGESGVSVNTDFGRDGFYIATPGWNTDAGAVTWVSWATGFSFGRSSFGGGISAANSIIGSAEFDGVGLGGQLFGDFNGHRLVGSTDWGGGLGGWRVVDSNVGAAGTITSLNGLVGASTNDRVGSNGVRYAFDSDGVERAYLISPDWNDGRGAITALDRTGEVGASNSLVGSVAGDAVGSGSFGTLSLSGQRSYVIHENWGGGRGAFTWLDGRIGEIDTDNSLVGANAGDRVGAQGVLDDFTSTGWVWLRSGDVGSGGVFGNGVGALTPIASKSTGAVLQSSGVVGLGAGSVFSLVGGGTGDRFGDFSTRVENLGNGAQLLISSTTRNPSFRSAVAGSVTYVSLGPDSELPVILGGSTTPTDPVAINRTNSLFGDGQFLNFAGFGDTTRDVGAIITAGDGSGDFYIAAPGADLGVTFDGGGDNDMTGAGRFWRVSINATGGGVGNVIDNVTDDDAPTDGTLFISAADVRETLISNFLTLEATTDITLEAGAIVGPASGDGIDSGLTLRAGRSVILNGRLDMQLAQLDIFSAYDDFSVPPDTGNGVIEMGSGGRISGTGSIRLAGHTIGSATAPIVFDTAPGGAPILLNSSGSGVFVAQSTGDLALSDYSIGAPDGATRELIAVAGNVLVDTNFDASDGRLILKVADTGTPRFIDVVGDRTITAARAEFVMQPGGALRVDGDGNRLVLTGGEAEIYNGVLNVRDGGVAQIDSALVTPAVQLDAGGTITGLGLIEAGLFAWNGGTLAALSGAEVFRVTGANATTVASSVTLDRRHLVTAPGLVLSTNGSNIELTNGARLQTGRVTAAPNAATVAIFTEDSDAQLLLEGGVDKTGDGTLRFAASGTTAGTWVINGGRVEFGLPTAFTPVVVHNGTQFSVNGESTLRFLAGDHTSDGSASVLGAGRVTIGEGVIGDTSAGANVDWGAGSTWGPRRTAVSAGQLRVGGTVTPNRLYDVLGGRLELTSSASAQMEQLRVDAGEAVLDGSAQTASFIQSGGDVRGSGQFEVISSYSVSGGNLGADFSNLVISHTVGDLVIARDTSSAGGLTLRAPNGRLVIDAPVGGETLTRLDGATGVRVRHALLAPGILQILSGGAIEVFERVTADSVAVSGASLTVDANPLNIFAGLISRGQLVVVSTGDVTVRAGNSNAAIEGGADALCTFNVGGDVNVIASTDNSARIRGFPDVGSALSPFTVGGMIRFDTAGGTGAARIDADEPDTIYLLFPNAVGGGYTIDGVEAISTGFSGFFAGGEPAVLGQNLFVTYGGGGGVPVGPTIVTEINALVATLDRATTPAPDNRRRDAPRIAGACK